jgi:hypothetical protein
MAWGIQGGSKRGASNPPYRQLPLKWPLGSLWGGHLPGITNLGRTGVHGYPMKYTLDCLSVDKIPTSYFFIFCDSVFN